MLFFMLIVALLTMTGNRLPVVVTMTARHMIDHRQLQLFLAVAERLNLSQAAEAMNITQPGVSKSMHRLQRTLRAQLYYRRGRGIELTEAGRALVRHAKLVETQFAEARQRSSGSPTGGGATGGSARARRGCAVICP